MSNEITPFLQPTNLGDAMKAAEMMANSTLVPEAFQGKPADILIAGQMGAELGVSWMQALSNIAVINGRPCIWGDLTLALVRRHPDFESIEETYDKDSETATCTIKRKSDKNAVTQYFSWQDAIDAGLTGKDTYKKYKRRMLQMRARSWAIRDCMPDALRGISVAEEVMDLQPRPTDIVVEAEGGVDKLKEALEKKDAAKADAEPAMPASIESQLEDKRETDDKTLEYFNDQILRAQSLDALTATGNEVATSSLSDDDKAELRQNWETRRTELSAADGQVPDFFEGTEESAA